MLCYCRVVASSVFITKKLKDRPLLSITLCKSHTALHRSHSIRSFYWDFWDNLLFFNPVCIRQKECTQCLVRSCIFQLIFDSSFVPWRFVLPPQRTWCSSSCYCKSSNRWFLNSSHTREADPQALHSYVRWGTSYYSMWECRQATRHYVQKRNQCSLWTVRWEMVFPELQCAVISHSGSSEGRRKVQLPRSLAVRLLRAQQPENTLTWPFPYISSSFIYEVFLIFILSPLCLLLCFFITPLEASLTFSSNTFSYTLTASPTCCLIPILLLLLSPPISVSSVL